MEMLMLNEKKNRIDSFPFSGTGVSKVRFFSVYLKVDKWVSSDIIKATQPPRPISSYSSDTSNICFQTVRYLVKWFSRVDPSCHYSIQDLLAILNKDKQYFQNGKV